SRHLSLPRQGRGVRAAAPGTVRGAAPGAGRRPPAGAAIVTAQLRRIAVVVGVAAITLLAVRPLAAEPVRVATLLPYVADALARVPEQATIVASVQRVTGGPNSGGIDLGTAHQPNLELLAAARPTLVVADAHRHAALAPKLAIGGAEVLLLRGDSVEATLDAIRTVAERVGAGPQLGAEIARVRAEL